MNRELIDRQKALAKKYMDDSDKMGDLTYHNWNHVNNVVKSAEDLTESIKIPDEDRENIILAAIWHDSDFAAGWDEHEERSAKLAEEAMNKEGLRAERISDIKRIIRATKMDFTPGRNDEKIIRDADLAHLGSTDYFIYYDGLLNEINGCQKCPYSDDEWRSECIKFLEKHTYCTTIAQSKFDEGKRKNLQLLMEMENTSLSEGDMELSKQEKKALKKERNKDKPKYNPEKGIETMFRVSLKNHITLSRIADDKANTLISVNAIILSIVLSALFPKLDSNPWLMYPGLSLILVSIFTIIMATLSTIPKTTHGSVSKVDVESKRGNLLFFGNFHKMSLKEYEWGIGELMKDGNYLYGSLTRDLYFLGKVLNRKYNLLRYGYFVFVIGLVVSIALFIWSILTLSPETVIAPA
ncbi:MAG: putative metal-dependent HD superfamily phosphohydrolase [Patiriisocius sp.]